MKTQSNNNIPTNFVPANAQSSAEFLSLRKTTQSIKTMKRLKAIILLVLVAAAAPPLLHGQITETHTFTTNRVVPDGNAAGLSDVRNISSAIAQIASVKVRLTLNGEFNSDLYGYVRHSSGFSVLLNRTGKTASNPTGYDDSGFNVTFETGAANGDIHLYRNVTTPVPGSPLTGSWEPDGRTADPSVVTEASPRGAALTSFNGLNAAGEWTLYLADVESGGTNQLREWAVEITGAAYPAIAWANPADIVYGTALGAGQLNAAVTYATTNVNGTFTYTPASGTVLGAGLAQTLSVNFTPADTTSFLPISTNVSINVQKAPLTITAENKTKVFGAALPELTATYSGFVLAQGTNDLTSIATLSTTANAASDGGTYPITASGAASPNYAFNYVPGTLTITQSLTVGAITSSANPALPGANVTFTMTVGAAAPGVGTPGGSVNFRIDGSIAGSGVLSGGAATFTINTLALGSHTVVAEYVGDVNFVGSTNALTPDQVINTPPVAGADTIERYPTQGVKVRLSTLLANDSDADADTLTISVGATSTNGATITVSGNWVQYTPAPGSTNVDQFTYTISDGRGAVVTGTVTVSIKVDNDPGQNLVITDLGGGSIQIRGSGIPGRTYRLQYTDTLAPAAWAELPGGSVTADATGAFVFTDTSGSPMRYYRSVYP
jgi:subtilisin-like proprotein convertase family protein